MSEHTLTSDYVTLIRHTDKMVFGEYRACEIHSRKKYTIRNGSVYIKFRGKWHEIQEIETDWINAFMQEISIKHDRFIVHSPHVEIVW